MNISEPLWTHEELRLFAALASDGVWFADGIQTDSRSVMPGDLFVALAGSQNDGHRFVEEAFRKGAVAAIVDRPMQKTSGSQILLKTGDSLQALRSLASIARKRLPGDVVAVTGSAGKTSVVQALKAALARQSEVHASIRSFNNHVGVPLSMARMPRSSRFGLFEIGTSAPGEIAPLSALVSPDVAIITMVGEAHQAGFATPEAIAEEKVTILDGVRPGGTAIIGMDHQWSGYLVDHAKERGLNVVRVSASDTSMDVYPVRASMQENCSCIIAELEGIRLSYKIAEPGEHWVLNSLLVLAAVKALGADIGIAALALAGFNSGMGRGRRLEITRRFGAFTLIDESYNANPASLRAGLQALALRTVKGRGRKFAVLADMQELGVKAEDMHLALAVELRKSGVQKVYAVGPMMENLARKAGIAVQRVADPADLVEILERALDAQDILYIKGANSARLADVVTALAREEEPVRMAGQIIGQIAAAE